MKRLLAVLFAFTYALCAWGFAEPVEPQPTLPAYRHILTISFSASPAELVLPGDVTLSFTITNTSEYDAENVYISSADGLHSEPIGQIGAGETQVFSREHTVTDDELEAGIISYTVTHDGIAGDTAKVDYAVECAIERVYASPSVEFTRQLSADYVAAGDIVTVIYSVSNVGNVPLASVRVRDSLGDFVGRVETLDVGETRIFTGKIAVSQRSVSNPTLSYSVPSQGDMAFTQTLSERVIELADEQIVLSVSTDKTEAVYGDSVEVTLTIRNLGNVDYYNIRVTDDINGGLMSDGLQSLNGSSPIVLKYVYPVRENADYRFRVTALSESANPVDMLSETATVSVSAAETDVPLKISAVAEYTEISRAGDVPVKVSIENSGDVSYENVALSENGLGGLYTFATIAANAVTARVVNCRVTQDTSLVFSVEYEDKSGNAHTAWSDPIDIAIARGGVRPESDSASGGFSGESVKPGSNSMFVIMMAVAGVLLIGLSVALFFSSRKARKARKLKLAQIKQRQKEELGKTNRFTPVKQRGERNRKGE